MWMKSKGKPSVRALLSGVGELITQAPFFHLLCTWSHDSNKQETSIATVHLDIKYKIVELCFFFFIVNAFLDAFNALASEFFAL